jgi:hypothetical protein
MDLTVALTQNAVSHVLPSGRKLTLDIVNGRYTMSGGYFGQSSIAADADITSPARLAAHWDAYVQVNKQEDAKHAPVARPLSRQEKKMAEALEKAQTLPKSMALYGPGGLLLSLKACEIFPEDPGNGVPALVSLPFGRAYASFDCAMDVGYLSGGRGSNFTDTDLTPAQVEWLDMCSPIVDTFVSGWFNRIKANPACKPNQK